jgi:deazaflavin-dependent oxidoreductase (nitroreductase family)
MSMPLDQVKQGLFDAGMPGPLLLLTTRGARSGKNRVTPLTYTRDGNRYVVLAAKLGAPEHPAWYHNLVVTVEVGSERFQARALVVEGSERDHLFNAHAAIMPNFAEYSEQHDANHPSRSLGLDLLMSQRCSKI